MAQNEKVALGVVVTATGNYGEMFPVCGTSGSRV